MQLQQASQRIRCQRKLASRSSRARVGRAVSVRSVAEPITNNVAATVVPGKELKIAAYSAKRYVKDFLEHRLVEHFPQSTFIEPALELDTAPLADGCDAVVLFVNDNASKEVVNKLAGYGVKIIAMRCAGFDRVDLAACAANGIKVVRVPNYSPQSVAEHAVAMMFALNRNLHLSYVRVGQGNYSLSGLVGSEVTGKTVGIIGTGAIGVQACRIFKGIGMRVLAYDVRPNPLCLDLGVEYMSIDDMLPLCDVVSLHCPLLPSTFHIINRERIMRMKRGAIVINVSRGGLIDSDALADGLENGQIGALGLDVYEGEGGLFFEDFTMYEARIRMKHWDRRFRSLVSYPQVLVTPHSAFLTHEALGNIAATTIENLNEYCAGKPLTNEVVFKP